VRKGAEKLQKFLNTKQQGRLDGFFSVKPKDKPAPAAKTNTKEKGTKRKVRSYIYSAQLGLTTYSGRRESRIQCQQKGETEISPHIFI
jgi:hypothetical protein